MKTIILTSLLFFYYINIYSQVTVTLSDPSKINSLKFKPMTITFKNDSIASGYGCFEALSFSELWYVDKKPTGLFVKQDEWKKYFAHEIKKIDFKKDGEDVKLVSIVTKGNMGASFLLYEIYTNEKISFYSPYPSYIYGFDKGKCNYFILKQGQEKAERMLINFSHKTKVLPSRVAKFFEDCPKVQELITSGKHKKSLDDMISILNYYSNNCNQSSK